ncbi:MAG: fibronectin type III domain-containing protein, partial [Acidobacteriota bacterium]|nr:fibronectin type III domain-containing protein [Acidobacteriota bacterium]
EPVFGDWSRTVEGTTDSPPAPVTTQLSAPTGLRADDETTTTITLSWGEVEDAESYEVQQQPADGGWGPASCGGDDSTVSVEECEVTGLTRGSGYGFQVRAHPDPDDDRLRSSEWSSTASARTSGPAPVDPVTGGDDQLDITWESKEASITWFWDAASDNRIGYVTAVRTPTADTPRPACPALNDDAWSAVDYANRRMITTSDGTESGTALTAGTVAGLCVRRTWMDDQGSQQYGPASLAWATTSPNEGTVPTGGVAAGMKPAGGTKTNAIDWYVALESGFDYNVQIVSKTYDGTDDLDCADASGAVTKLKGTRHRLSNPSTYTTYTACVMAENGDGSSGSFKLATYHTPPKAPAFGAITLPKYTRGDVSETTAGAWSGNMVWPFGGEPDASTQYDMAVIRSTSESALRTQAQCTTGFSTSPTITATGEAGNRAFQVTLAHDDSLVSLQVAPDGTADVKTYIHTCVRAKLSGTQATTVGPWKVDAQTLTATKHSP